MSSDTDAQLEHKHRAVHLSCGCCGAGFRTWPSYRDQDQDAGYGICRGCQADAHHRNRADFREAGDLLRSALNPTNQAKYDRLAPWKKRALVWQALDDGTLTFSIVPR